MAAIARLATFVLALGLVVMSCLAAWFHIHGLGPDVRVVLDPLPFRGSSGLVVKLCDDCPDVPTGRLAGGLAWLAAYVALQFAVALAASAAHVVRHGSRHTGLVAWALISAVGLALLTVGVIAAFDAPPPFRVTTGVGVYAALAACALAVLGHSRVLDRLDGPVAELVVPPTPGAARQVTAGPARDLRIPATLVRRADLGHAGMRVTTDQAELRVAWADLIRAQLITGDEPAVELSTATTILRVTRKSVVDYRFLPGATGGTPADDLRRLYDYARERNPALRVL